MDLGIEECDTEALRGKEVGVGVRNAGDQSVKAETTQVVGHLRRGVQLVARKPATWARRLRLVKPTTALSGMY